MIARCAAHATAGRAFADVNLFRPRCIREAVNQALAVLLLIRLAVAHIRFATMIARPDAVMTIRRILWRQIAVIAQHLTQFAQFGRSRDMTHGRRPDKPVRILSG